MLMLSHPWDKSLNVLKLLINVLFFLCKMHFQTG